MKQSTLNPLMASEDTRKVCIWGAFGRVLVPEVHGAQGKIEPRPGRVGTNMLASPLGIGLASRGG